MKDHVKAKMINNLRDIAVAYHAHGCLRQMLLEEVTRAEREGLADLIAPATDAGGNGEAMVQSRIRLRAAQLGYGLWRNNVGVLPDRNGRPVRYGLANDSAKLNKAIKSADLIGIRPVKITPDMVGHIIGQFVSLEVKPANWRYSGNDRELAQSKWMQIVTALGGHAKFITHEEQL